MSEREKYVQECMVIVRETLWGLMEDHYADDRIALLVEARKVINGMLNELTED